jgi:DNA-binding transcriptional MerR regulator
MNIELKNKLYYNIGEVSKAFKVNSSLLRFWEKEFNIIKPKKNKKGNRYFTKNDIENLHLIYHLVKERKYTLDGARKKIRENKSESTNNFKIIFELKKIRADLVAIREAL